MIIGGFTAMPTLNQEDRLFSANLLAWLVVLGD